MEVEDLGPAVLASYCVARRKRRTLFSRIITGLTTSWPRTDLDPGANNALAKPIARRANRIRWQRARAALIACPCGYHA